MGNNQTSVTLNDQQSQLKHDRNGIINFSVARDVAKRVDGAYKNFWRRCRSRPAGEKPGYPKFKPFDVIIASLLLMVGSWWRMCSIYKGLVKLE